MPHTQTKGRVHLHVRMCAPLSLISGTVEGIVLKFGYVYGPTSYALHVCYKWVTMLVLMCTFFFRILGSTGRTMQKFGVLLDHFLCVLHRP